MPSPRIYFGPSSGSGPLFDKAEITFVAAQAAYALSSAPKANSSHFYLKAGLPLTEGTDYTIAGTTLSLILASPLCQTLVAGDMIEGNWTID